jgi:hypothetical protein
MLIKLISKETWVEFIQIIQAEIMIKENSKNSFAYNFELFEP